MGTGKSKASFRLSTYQVSESQRLLLMTMMTIPVLAAELQHQFG